MSPEALSGARHFDDCTWASRRRSFASSFKVARRRTRELCDLALAHAIENKNEAAYHQGDQLATDSGRAVGISWFVQTP
jgi:hypothetical protein